MKISRINAQFHLFLLVILLNGTVACNSMTLQPIKKDSKISFEYSVPTRGNSWVINAVDKNSEVIQNEGIKNWSDKTIRIRTYFKLTGTGNLNVGLKTKNVSGKSTIKVLFENNLFETVVSNAEWDTISVGIFTVSGPGYHWIEFQGLEKTGDFFPEIESILIGGEATAGDIYFVKDDFYWGRRGPSVHLNFQVPENAGEVQYFYNEITIPENNDVLGSYFMADGFGQGYFGMQVNSPTERRILFSVWSPYKTDNPQDIPDEYKITLIKKGEGVHTGEFGNEGSGGQSYLKFDWKAGTTYRFLLKAQPTGNGETDFTSWFFAPEAGSWKLIASWRRPKTETYLTHLYSFLENFKTETGNITRKGNYSNQWIFTTSNQWVELTKIKFTADATARKESRMDYAGGVEEGKFYLRNCGFFSETTTIDSYFERPATGTPPEIRFEELP